MRAFFTLEVTGHFAALFLVNLWRFYPEICDFFPLKLLFSNAYNVNLRNSDFFPQNAHIRLSIFWPTMVLLCCRTWRLKCHVVDVFYSLWVEPIPIDLTYPAIDGFIFVIPLHILACSGAVTLLDTLRLNNSVCSQKCELNVLQLPPERSFFLWLASLHFTVGEHELLWRCACIWHYKGDRHLSTYDK